jgi:hypothetical protein
MKLSDLLSLFNCGHYWKKKNHIQSDRRKDSTLVYKTVARQRPLDDRNPEFVSTAGMIELNAQLQKAGQITRLMPNKVLLFKRSQPISRPSQKSQKKMRHLQFLGETKT